jgi:hypothetical protein
METQNASAEGNRSDDDTAPASSTVQPDSASEAATGGISTASTMTEGSVTEATIADPVATEPKPSYVKLAMRNMVRKRGLSLKHFALTTIGLLAFLVGLSYLTR